MDPQIHPEHAVDLSKSKGAADLSKEAIEQREREKKLYAAGARARKFCRTFKGITGNPGRRKHIENALRHEGLID